MTCGKCSDNPASKRSRFAWCMILRNWRWLHDKCAVSQAMRQKAEEGET